MTTGRTRPSRMQRAGLAVTFAGLVLGIGGMFMVPAGASVADAEPEVYQKNKTCQNFGYDFGFKLEPQGIPEEKDYTVPPSDDLPGGATITIDNVETVNGRVEFDWSSTVTWSAVMVKQADGGLIYEYDPAVSEDQNVQTVSGQNQGGISHVNFCGAGEGDPECEPGQLGTFPDCQDPCQFNPQIPADDPACGVCEEGQLGTFPDCQDPCELDPTLPADDPECAPEVEACAFNAALDADDPLCVESSVLPGGTATPPAVAAAAVAKAPAVAAAELPRTGTGTAPLAAIGLGLVLMGASMTMFGKPETAELR